MMLLCGSMRGSLFFYDARAMGKPLGRPPPVRGAVVRLQLWEEPGDRFRDGCTIAAVLSSEEGLCSVTVKNDGACQVRRCASGAGASSRTEKSPASFASPPRLFYDVARLLGTTGTM